MAAPPHHILQICPSLGKECGIARYSLYVKDALESKGFSCSIVRCCQEADQVVADLRIPVVVLVQHEYGLYDSLNPSLSSSDTTSSLLYWLKSNMERDRLASAAIIMHTIVCTDWLLSHVNRQIFSSGVRVFHLSSDGSKETGTEYLDHGIPIPHSSFLSKPSDISYTGLNQQNQPSDLLTPTVGAFGMLSPNKLPLEILSVCQRAGWNLVGCFASRSEELTSDLASIIAASGVSAKTYHDFADEDVILERLSQADVLISFQSGVPHFATSGSIRFLFNLGRPVICNPCRQFMDIGEAVIYSNPQSAHVVLERLQSNPREYQWHCQRLQSYSWQHELGLIYSQLIRLLLGTPYPASPDYRSCVLSPTGQPLELCPPFSAPPLSPSPASPSIRHVDVILASCLPQERQYDYLLESLDLDQSTSADLQPLLAQTAGDVSQRTSLIISLAESLGAVVTWGLLDDIQTLAGRPPVKPEVLVSGYPLITILQCISVNNSCQADGQIVSHWMRLLESDQSNLRLLIKAFPAHSVSWSDLSITELTATYHNALFLAHRIRRIFHPGTAARVNRHTMALISTTRRIEAINSFYPAYAPALNSIAPVSAH